MIGKFSLSCGKLCLRHSALRCKNHYCCLSSSSTTAINSCCSSSLNGNKAKREFSSLVQWESNQQTKVGTITLQSPETYNALTEEMGKEFQDLVVNVIHKELTTNTNTNIINAIIITGQGDDAFSAGGNIDWLKSLRHNSIEENTEKMLAFYHSFLCIRTFLPVPIIAAISGPAVGAGACLALACDIRIGKANHKKLLGFPFTKLGIHSGMGGSHFLRHTINCPSKMMEILLLGKLLSSQEAYELGLLNDICEDPKEQATKVATQIATETNPLAIRLMIQTLRRNQDVGLDDLLHREATAQALCYNRNDWGEGLDAVMEKRTPNFNNYFEKSTSQEEEEDDKK